jgi:hypothetical protein
MWRDGVGFCRFLTRSKIQSIIMLTAGGKVSDPDEPLPGWLAELNDNEVRELVALFWFGRADFPTMFVAKRYVVERDREELIHCLERRHLSRFLQIAYVALDGGLMPGEVRASRMDKKPLVLEQT